MSQQPHCPLCGGVGIFYTEKSRCQVQRCQVCKTLFVSPLPSDPLAIYEGDYFDGATQGFGYTDYDRDKEPMVPTFHAYLRRIARYAPPSSGKRMLDVGAATGFFLNLARQEGWETAGVEPSNRAAGLARKKQLDVKTGILEPGLYPEESFDVITLWDVVEHLPDPVAILGLVRSLLKPGGIVAINTPDASSLWARGMGVRWHLLCPPEHLCLFTQAGLKQGLQRAGLELLECDKIGKSFTLQYVFQTLAHWQKLGLWDAVVRNMQGTALGRASIPLNLYDNFFALARKPS